MDARELRIGNYHNYAITSNGEVYNKRGKKIAVKINDKGYPCVMLSINGKSVFRRVHRLVAELFIPNPDNKPCVNQKDRNRANSNVENLEWVTYSENVIYSVIHGGRNNWTRNNTGERNSRAKLKFKTIEAIRVLYKNGFSQNDLSEIFDLDQSRITKIVNYKIWISKN